METEIIRSKNDSGRFIITDKRITKIGTDGTTLDIPADMISAVKKTSNSIILYSAIGEMEMEFIGNVEAVYKAIISIIVDRQDLKASVDKLVEALAGGATVAAAPAEEKAETKVETKVEQPKEEKIEAPVAAAVIAEEITDDTSILDDIAAEEAKVPVAPVVEEPVAPAEPVRKRVVNPNPTFNQKPSIRAPKEEAAGEDKQEPAFKKHVVSPNSAFSKNPNVTVDPNLAKVEEVKEEPKPAPVVEEKDDEPAPTGGLMRPNQPSANSFRRPMQTPSQPPMGFLRNAQPVEGAEEADTGIRRRSLGLGASEEPAEEPKLRSADREESSNANRQSSPFASASTNNAPYSPFAPAPAKSKLGGSDDDDDNKPLKPIWAR